MNRFTWLRNPLVKFDDKNLRLVPPNPAGKWCLIAADETTEFSPVEISEGELAVLFIERRLSFRLPGAYDPTLLKRERLAPTINDLPEAQRKEAIRRNSYVKALQDAGCKSCSPSALIKLLIGEIAKDLGDPCPPHPISIYRWARRSAESGRGVLSLRRKSWGTNTGRDHRLPERTVEIVNLCIDTIYLEGRESGEATRKEILRVISNENLSLPPTKQLVAPSLATIYRIINGRDAYERAVARYGEDEANRRFRHSKAGLRATRPNERVEVDHTPLDLFVVDEHSHLPLGRPWITVAIDKRSRMVLGFHISFSPPSVEAVMHCLRHAVLPKIDLKARYPALKNSWLAYGLPETLVVDNGLEFHAEALEAAALGLGFRIEFGGKRKPFHKGAIERFLKTLNYNLIHKLPGTSFAKYWQRFDFDPLKNALITLEKLHEVIHRWILDVYGQEVHRGISEPPALRWQRESKMYAPELPACVDKLDIHFSQVAHRRVWHYGIQLHSDQFYQSSELQDLRRRYGEKLEVQVRFHNADMTQIHVQDPESEEYITVENTAPDEVRGMSATQYKWIRAYRKKMARTEERELSIAEAKAELRKLVSELFESKKLRDRTKGERMKDKETKANETQGIEKALNFAPEDELVDEMDFETTLAV